MDFAHWLENAVTLSPEAEEPDFGDEEWQKAKESITEAFRGKAGEGNTITVAQLMEIWKVFPALKGALFCPDACQKPLKDRDLEADCANLAKKLHVDPEEADQALTWEYVQIVWHILYESAIEDLLLSETWETMSESIDPARLSRGQDKESFRTQMAKIDTSSYHTLKAIIAKFREGDQEEFAIRRDDWIRNKEQVALSFQKLKGDNGKIAPEDAVISVVGDHSKGILMGIDARIFEKALAEIEIPAKVSLNELVPKCFQEPRGWFQYTIARGMCLSSQVIQLMENQEMARERELAQQAPHLLSALKPDDLPDISTEEEAS
jgi:hypothetical protein